MSIDGGATTGDTRTLAVGSQDDELKRLVLERYESLVEFVGVVAKQIFRSINGLVEMEELLSAGREGLYEAALRFDEEQGVPFRAFANYRVRGAIMDAVRKASWLPRKNQQRVLALQAMGLLSEGSVAHVFVDIDSSSGDRVTEGYLDDHIAAVVTAAAATTEPEAAEESASGETIEPVGNPEEALARHEMLGLIRESMSELNEQEATVVRMLYFEHRSLEETAKVLNVQKPWACRLQTRAIERLTKRLRQ